jgi:pimeloyl-ACP methyl ester carboxylesterase
LDPQAHGTTPTQRASLTEALPALVAAKRATLVGLREEFELRRRSSDLDRESKQKFVAAKNFKPDGGQVAEWQSLGKDAAKETAAVKDALRTQAEELQAKTSPLNAEAAHIGVPARAEFVAILNQEDETAYEALLSALAARDSGQTLDYAERLEDIAAFRDAVRQADLALLNETVFESDFTLPDGTKRTTRKTFLDLLPKDILAKIQKRAQVAEISAFFSSLDGDAGGKVPGALLLEPVFGDAAEEFRNKVSVPGMVSVYVPRWQTRVIVPLALKEALASGSEISYVMPGTGSVASHAVSSVNMTLEVFKRDGKWQRVPFLTEFPQHGFAPTAPEFHSANNTLGWIVDHLRDLTRVTGQLPHFVGRSTGALFGLYMSRYFPGVAKSILAYSPPSPSRSWIDYGIGYFSNTTDFAPSPQGYSWINGGANLARITSMRERTDLDWSALLAIKGIREELDFTAPLGPEEDPSTFTPTVILWGMDDKEYPKKAAAFAGQSFPASPLNQIWREAQARFPHITALGLPGGHFQLNKDYPAIRNLAKRLVAQHLETPGALLSQERLMSELAAFARIRDMKLALIESGLSDEALLSEGKKRFEDEGDLTAATLWQDAGMLSYLKAPQEVE